MSSKTYTINGKTIKIKPHQFEGHQSLEHYENQIYSALSKIGISKDYISINYNEELAQVNWKINSKNFSFQCESQQTKTQNLGAIAQAIQEDIRQITRGIKDLFLIMTQYETKIKQTKKSTLFDYHNENSSEETFQTSKIKIDSPIDEILDKKYFYLEKYDNQKLDSVYHKLKEQCIQKNYPDHPMLKALKIIRQKKGLKL